LTNETRHINIHAVLQIKKDMAGITLEVYELHAEFCSICANPKRLRIMMLLGEGELSVGAIAEDLGMPEHSVSQHLRLMKDRNAVKARKDGRTVYYSITNKKFLKGARLIREGIIEEMQKIGRKFN